MSTIPVVTDPIAGASGNRFNNLGKPVTGNTGMPSPIGGPIVNPGPVPGGGGLISSSPVLSGPLGDTPTPGGGLNQGLGGGVAVGAVPNTYNPTSPTGSGSLLNTNPVPVAGGVGLPTSAPGTVPSPLAPGTLTQEQNKQLIDTFGKGTGSLLASEISNIGSGDSSYLQAYKNAMAQTNAENLATLNTTLGNEGISSSSSVAAIENADFETGVTAQEGLQEQQLQMNDLAQLLGLTESIEQPSVAEVSSGGFLNDLASITSSIGNLIPFGSGGNKGNAGNVSPEAGLANIQSMSNASTAGLATTDPALTDLIGEGVVA